MNLFKYISVLLLALWLPQTAHGLDNASGVKVTPLIKTTHTWNGGKIIYPQGPAEITGLMVEIAPGSETGWHEHPVSSFGIVLQGVLEVSLQNGDVKRLQAGDALAEVIDTWHNGRSVGKEPVKIVVFYAGAVGSTLTIRHPDAEGSPAGKTQN